MSTEVKMKIINDREAGSPWTGCWVSGSDPHVEG